MNSVFVIIVAVVSTFSALWFLFTPLFCSHEKDREND